MFFYEPVEDEYAYKLKGARFYTNSETINSLFDEGKIGVSLIVECSKTAFRKSYPMTREGHDVILRKVDFTEKVDVSMFAYAKEDFTFSSNELDEDYAGIDFEIEKYDILGAYDGFNIRFKHDETENNLVQSIFSVTIDHEMDDGSYIVDCGIGKKIGIIMSEKDYKNYKIIYTVPTYKEVFFNMILIPALIEGLSLCKIFLEDESKDLEDVGNQYIWFRSIQNSYKKLNGADFSLNEFKQMSPVLLAQSLLGKPLGESLKKLVNETTKGDEVDSENE
ncbi:MAG: hypothetical protein ACI3XX_06195 [Eubacteriales bacterium]